MTSEWRLFHFVFLFLWLRPCVVSFGGTNSILQSTTLTARTHDMHVHHMIDIESVNEPWPPTLGPTPTTAISVD